MCITSNLSGLGRVDEPDNSCSVIALARRQRRHLSVPEQCLQCGEVVDGQSESGDLGQTSPFVVSGGRHDSSQTVEGIVQLAGTSTFALGRRLISSTSHLPHAAVRRPTPSSSRRTTLTSLLAAAVVYYDYFTPPTRLSCLVRVGGVN